MSLLDALIAQGMKNNEEFTKELINIKKRVANTPERQAIQELQNTTSVMQSVDEFTLTESVNTKTDTQVMQEIDEYTLQTLMEVKSQVDELATKMNGRES